MPVSPARNRAALAAPPWICLHPQNPLWPSLLCALPRPPQRLFVWGTLPSLHRTLTIVGTRRADVEALAFSRKLAERAAQAGCTIVSGGAQGIDAAAHQGALDAGGKTLVVLGCGLASPYPPQNRQLFAQIRQCGGAIVSEYEPGAPPADWRFAQRNRLLAALGQDTVVVQAPARSGALITAGWAKRLGRPVWATSSAPWDPRGAGCRNLVRSGAQALDSIDGMFPRARQLRFPAESAKREPPHRTGARSGSSRPRSASSAMPKDCPPADRTPQAAGPETIACPSATDLSPDARHTLALLGMPPRHLDELLEITQWPLGRLQGALLELILAGHAIERSPARYSRSASPPFDGGPFA